MRHSKGALKVSMFSLMTNKNDASSSFRNSLLMYKNIIDDFSLLRQSDNISDVNCCVPFFLGPPR